MRKSLSKLLAAGICVAGVSTASAWTSVSESTMSGFKNTDVVTSFGFNSDGTLSMVDGYNKSRPNNEYDRYYVIAAYGMNSSTSYIKNTDGSYKYGTVAGGSSRVHGFYDKDASVASGAKFTLSTANLDTLATRAKSAGYYKIRLVVDSLSHSDDGSTYKSEFTLGKQRAHYVDYVIPPSFGTLGIDSVKYNGSVTKYSTPASSYQSYVHSDGSVWFSALMYGDGSTSYYVEIEHTNQAKGATTTTTNTDVPKTYTTTLSPTGTRVKTYLGAADSWIKEGDQSVRIRFCNETTKYTTIAGVAKKESHCTNYITVGVKNYITTSTADANMGSVSSTYTKSLATNGSYYSLSATPKAGYVFDCWKNSSGTCVSTSNPIKVQSLSDTTLQANFKVAPLTSSLKVGYRRYNGVVQTANNLTAYNFVVGKDTMAFTTKVSGPSKTTSYIIQYSHDGGAWNDAYWYYATANETVEGYEMKASIGLNNLGTIVKPISDGDLVKSGIVRGNSYTKFRMKSFHSSANKYSTAISGTQTDVQYTDEIIVNWLYPVTLQKSNGTQISSANYAYNTTFTFPTNIATIGVPEDDVGKETYTYSWVNVNNDSDRPSTSFKVTAPVTYKVDLKAKYVVDFLDFDGSSWKQYNVNAYSACTTPSNPNHKNNTTDYKFSKWDKSFTNITGYTVVNAVYDNRVTFIGKEGVVLKNYFVATNAAAVAPAAPSVAGYEFVGWDKDFSAVKDSMTVTAKYVKIPVVEYTFSGASGGALVNSVTLTPTNSCIIPNAEIEAPVQGVHPGTTLSVMAEDAVFVNGSAYNIIAAFTVSQEGDCANDDLVKDFVAAASAGIKAQVRVEGTLATLPTAATAETILTEGVSFRYKFSAGNAFIITFLDADGETELEGSGLFAEGTVLEAPENYTVPENNAQYTYSFAGWSPALATVTGAATYIAQIDSVVNKYTVVFFDENDDEIAGSEQVLPYGSAAVAPTTNPTQAGYVFTGWDEDIDFVGSDLNVYPVFIAVPTIKFDADEMYAGANNISVEAPSSCFTVKNAILWDASEEEMLSINPGFAMEKGVNYVWKASVTMNTVGECAEDYLVKDILETAEYADAVIPVKVNDIVANADIKGSVSKFTLKVPFTAGAGKFTVIFAQADGTVIKEEKLEEGELPVAPATTAIDVPEATAKNTYVFAGWNSAIVEVTANVTYTAVIEEKVNKYTVTFIYDDKTVPVEYEYGDLPVAPEDLAACPEGDAEFVYECAWDEEFDYVTTAAVYTHTVTKVKAKYEVTYDFQPYNILHETLEYGEMPEAPAEFVCPEGSEILTYECSWDKEFEAVTGAVTYTYTAKQIRAKFEITYVFVNGFDEAKYDTVKTMVEHGEIAGTHAPEWECPESDAEYTNQCVWDAMSMVSGEATYHYTLQKLRNSYEITFKFGDKTETAEVEYGEMPEAPESFKCSEKTAEKTYTCKWDKEFAKVTGEATYTMTETSSTNKYTITFKFGDKTETASVEYGKVPTAPKSFTCSEDTDEYEYTCKWDKEFAKVTGKATYTYSETKSKQTYTVKVSVNDSKMGEITGLNKDGKYEYGSKVELVAKAKDGYKFVGWTDDKKAEAKRTVTVTKDLKLEAKFEKKSDAIIATAAPKFHMAISGRDVTILGASIGAKIAVLDMQGRVISAGRVESADYTVAVPRAGMYIVRVNNQAQKINVR